MPRIGIAGALVICCSIVSALPAQAAETPTFSVSGSFSGTGTLDTSCADVHMSDSATGDLAPFGPSVLTFNFCVALPQGNPVMNPVTSGSLTVTNAAGEASGTLSGWVAPFFFTPNGFPYELDVAVTGGTGRYVDATGVMVISGFFGIGATTINGTASGSVSFGSIPTAKRDCKNGEWRDVLNTNGEAFVSQGSCIAFVQHQQRAA